MSYPTRGNLPFHSSDLTIILAKLNELSTLGAPEVKGLIEDISEAVRAKLDQLNREGAPPKINAFRNSMVSIPPTIGGKSRKKFRGKIRKRKYSKHN
jgi:hypothetical protein